MGKSKWHSVLYDSSVILGLCAITLATPALSSCGGGSSSGSSAAPPAPSPAPAPASDAIVKSVKFDSRDLQFKQPFGAVTTGSKIRFALLAMPGIESASLVVEKRRLEGNQDVLQYHSSITVPMSKSQDGNLEQWTADHTFADKSVYGYYFELTIGGKKYVYQNNSNSIYWEKEKGSNGIGIITPKPASVSSIRRYRQTVYDADFAVPGWARDAVYYYIFPERFRNGNPQNDPDPATATYQDHAVEFHSNWNAKPYVPDSGDGSDKVWNNDFFGGDIAGIIEKLDYIKSLGANTLYINPLFKAASNHKYDTADYKVIDPHFGTTADFKLLNQEAAKRGMRVIMDTSFNHTGTDSVYFDRYGKYDTVGAFEGGKITAASPYYGWYQFSPNQSDPNKQYAAWLGIADLPALDKMSASYRNFAFGAPDSVTAYWMDQGIAGWRMDVAPWVPDDFWREWRKVVKAKDPEALTIAETWFDSSKFFLGDQFDSTMNYILRDAVLNYAGGSSASSIYSNIEMMRENYPQQAFYALMNMLSSHDVERALYHLGYTSDAVGATKIAEAKQRLRLATLFVMSFPGAPTIYYGDEAGITGGKDPFNRTTYPWEDRGGKPDNALLTDIAALVKMRHDYPVLRRGTIDAPIYLDNNAIVLVRQDGATWAIIATNNSKAMKQVTVKLPAAADAAQFKNVLTGAEVKPANGELTLTIPALYGSVLISQ